jgi:hypothetical protein
MTRASAASLGSRCSELLSTCFGVKTVYNYGHRRKKKDPFQCRLLQKRICFTPTELAIYFFYFGNYLHKINA